MADTEHVFRTTLPVIERVLAPDHPDTLSTRHGVAQVMAALGRVAEAERLHREILQARERVLGHDAWPTL